MYFKSFISSYCALTSVGLLMVERGREWKKSQDNLMEKGMYFHRALFASYCYHAAIKDLSALKILTYGLQYVGASLAKLCFTSLQWGKTVSAALKDQYRNLLQLHHLVSVFLSLVSAKLPPYQWLKWTELNLLHFGVLSLSFPPVNFDLFQIIFFFSPQEGEHKANVCYFYLRSQIPCILAALYWQKSYSKIIRACKLHWMSL